MTWRGRDPLVGRYGVGTSIQPDWNTPAHLYPTTKPHVTALQGDFAGALARTRSAETGAWSDWIELEPYKPGLDGDRPGARGATEPVWVGPSDGAEVRVNDPSGELPAGLRLDLVDPGKAAARGTARTASGAGAASTPSMTAAVSTASATTTASATATGTTADAVDPGPPSTVPQPPVVTRAEWGADESLNDEGPVYLPDATVKAVFVHHTTNGVYDCAQSAEIVRSLHVYHVKTNGWRDLGYNFLVDKCGTIFEGRQGGFVQPAEGERTARRLPLVAEAEAGKYNAVSFSWRRSDADPWTRIPVGDVTSGGTALGAWPVPLDNGRNAPLVWNATSTVDPDGTVQIKADFTGPDNAASSTAPLTAVVDRNADGAATDDVGPGSLNLLTGNYTLSETDVSLFGLSASRTAASRTPNRGAAQEGQAAIFGAATATASAVSVYRYDANGSLRQQWDPRLGQATQTQYPYWGGRVTWLQQQSGLPYTFTYGNGGAGTAPGDGMLLKASRPALKQGTTDTTEGEAVTAVVYGVPLTGAKAPHAMSSAAVAAWGQLDAPTDATAVFPADAVPASHDGADMALTGYRRATVTYLNASGRTVNTATPGGHIDVAEYDRFGNTVRELSAGNRALALGAGDREREQLTDLGIIGRSAAERAHLLSTTSLYDETGSRELEEFGPLRRVDLTEDLKEGGTLLVPSGTSVPARSWTVNEYDEGRPTDGSATVKNQVTLTVTGARVRDYHSVMGEKRVATTQYDWAKGMPTLTTRDAGGLALTTTTEYDARGRITSQVLPGGTGSDAATRITEYWSASGTGWCKGRPEWADQPCWTGPGGDITGGGSQPSKLVNTTIEYDRWGSPATVTDEVGGVYRTTTTTYDNAGRPVTSRTTGGLGQAVPETTTEYDPATGQVTEVSSPTGGTVTKAYDKLGRLISYTDADGGVTRTEYDLLDRPVKVTDGAPSTVVYTYDHTAEPRGLATRTADSVAGTFEAVYDADGSVSSEKLPGGYTLDVIEDTTGSTVSRIYTRDSDGATVYSDRVTESVHGQVTSHQGWSSQTYGYDGAGRLASVDDTVGEVCTRRSYTFDKRTNRTSLSTATAAPGAACTSTAGTAATHTYDSADRLVDAGYTYDAFGRTTALPGSTVGYYANDLVHQQTAGDQRRTWTLDAAHRFRSFKTETGSGSSWTRTGSKLNHYDGDGDNPRWIIEDTATGTLTRNVDSASGDLAATTGKTGDAVLQLTTVHGDVALQLPLDTSKAPVALDSDEYGNSRAGQAPTRYNWLGAKQRSTETLTGLTLMGVRLYDPTTGRFLSVDPVYGGGDNAYAYPGDPVNQYDLDGRAWNVRGWWNRQRSRHASADALHSAVVFGVGVASLRNGKAVWKAAKRLKWRHVRHPMRTARYIRRSCSSFARCVTFTFGVSRSSKTYRHGRNLYRHGRRFSANFHSLLGNTLDPRKPYGYRKWKGRF
ncbi:RHS repeat-associated core domain-containing protein [Streptomyces sp. NPDC090026]|uniref:RHS repeat-associated core domain-containing protein n=1 Tax=Streptomyces sp. NPDC090026 TaxID=3365923 RepID=UPI0037F79568